MWMRAIVVAASVFAGVAAVPALAEDVALTIHGKGLAEGGAAFTLSELEAMPQTSFNTATVWTDGVHEFSGVSLKALLAQVGATGEVIKARALNDYVIEIPAASLEDDAPIIATRIDGARFPRREKGPLWIVYPYDSKDEYRTEMIFGRSIWQLSDLSVN